MDTKSLIDEFIIEYAELKRFAASLGHNQNDILDLMQDLAETLLVKEGEKYFLNPYVISVISFLSYKQRDNDDRKFALLSFTPFSKCLIDKGKMWEDEN